ncbi:MAG TPA: adenylate/guanylate cyclase domain-containing protein [Gaiellaceae bacterium]|nr:adenylate/guanylate cyclase domain-containing protein [Gaiellaceae bacterium]
MQECRECGQANPDGFRLCGMCGSPLGVEEPERRKPATLLFCDMSGSTAMGERVDAESVRELMFRYFHEMRSALERHGGTVEKFIGDAVMAVFGVPEVHEDDALRAVRAAMEMRERLASLNEELERRFGTRVSLRIGVNTGEVVAGESSSRQALVTGDAVNVAARLEQAAAPDEILLGEATYRLVRDAVSAAAVQPLQAKGKSNPLRAYRLLGLIGDGPARSRRLHRRIVGRAAELRALERTFADAFSERRCAMVTIVGHPGVGKSRLAEEFVSLVAGDARVLGGRCLAYGEGITFWALAEIVRQAAGIRDEDTQETARGRLAALVHGEADGAEIAERVAQAIGLARGTASASEIAWAIRKLFEGLARRRPLVLLVDDLQWAEPTFLDVLTALVDSVADAPILLLCLARPELIERGRRFDTTIALEPLGESESMRLIEDVLGEGKVNAEVGDGILRATEGNPLFVEELLAMLVEEGFLRREDGQWLPMQDLARVAIPPTINALLAARLERLEPRERAAIERGSMEGQLFHRGAIVELSPLEWRSDVARDLEAVVDKGFIAPAEATFADEAAFRFRHILIRDAAYAAMPKKLRAELHERLAAWLERRAGDRIAEHEEILGYHLEQGYLLRAELAPVDASARELARAAARRLASAGQRALARGDLPAARSLFARTSTLLPPGDPIRLTLLPDRGAALGYQLEGEYRKRVALGRVDEETRQLARAAAERLASAGRRAITRGDTTAAVNLFAKAISLLPRTDRLRLELLPDLVAALVDTREFDRARDLVAEAVEIAGLSGDADLAARLLPLRSKLQVTQDAEAPQARVT